MSKFPPPMTVGDMLSILAEFPADAPLAVKFDPWAPVARTVEHITTDEGITLHMGPTNPNFD